MAETKTSNKRMKGQPAYSCKHFKMIIMTDQTAETIKENAAEGLDSSDRVKTDNARGFSNLGQVVKSHKEKTVKPMHAGKEQPWVHIALSDAKRNLMNTCHHVDETYPQNYLDEFSYKLNRRYIVDKLFERFIVARISFAWFAEVINNGQSLKIILNNKQVCQMLKKQKEQI